MGKEHKVKILYVITGLGGGGAEKVVSDLADQMHQIGHEVKIAYLTGDISVRPKSDQIEIIYLGLDNILDLFNSCVKYKKLILSFRPDVIHSHMIHANIFARINRFISHVPKLICTAHSNNEGGRLRMIAYRLTHFLADLTTNVSDNASLTFQKLGAVPKNEIKTIYNGIDLDHFFFCQNLKKITRKELNLNENTFVFLAVGRFHIAKDYPNLIQAFSFLNQKIDQKTEVHLLIAGEGELKTEIIEQVEHMSLTNKVTFLGRRNDIRNLMCATDFFVLSSSFEGFGLVVAEAMACKSFVISTDCGGTAEIMGNTGFLVPPKDSLALADAMFKAISLSEEYINTNNIRARKRVEQEFSLQTVINKWLNIYETK